MHISAKLKSVIRDVPDYPKAGILFRDITPIFTDPALMKATTEALVAPYRDQHIDAIAAVEARGFIFGVMMAATLGCAFVPVRKAGKLPYRTRKERYSLEYGTAEMEMHVDALQPGWRVIVHDDLLATGGTAAAAARLVVDSGGELAGFSFLVHLGFLPGAYMLQSQFGLRPDCLVHY